MEAIKSYKKKSIKGKVKKKYIIEIDFEVKQTRNNFAEELMDDFLEGILKGTKRAAENKFKTWKFDYKIRNE